MYKLVFCSNLTLKHPRQEAYFLFLITLCAHAQTHTYSSNDVVLETLRESVFILHLLGLLEVTVPERVLLKYNNISNQLTLNKGYFLSCGWVLLV